MANGRINENNSSSISTNNSESHLPIDSGDSSETFGWLMKRTRISHKWKKQRFCLKNADLYYGNAEQVGVRVFYLLILTGIYKGCDYQADVYCQTSNTIKQTSVGKCQILSSRRLLANLKYYQADVCWQISNTMKPTM